MVYSKLYYSSFRSGVLLFTCLLISGDLAFMALHSLNASVLETPSPFFDIERDRGVAEFFQYIKYIWIGLLLLLIAKKSNEWGYLSWSLVFIYLLFDDAIKIHETVGTVLAKNMNFAPLFGLRMQDFGELAVSITAGAVLLPPILICMAKGSVRFQKTSIDILLLVGVLAFFGVLVDMIHIALPIESGGKFLLGLVEDGGEMVSVSLMVGYAFMRTNICEDAFIIDEVRQRLLSKSQSYASLAIKS